jgi:hypothetical protein
VRRSKIRTAAQSASHYPSWPAFEPDAAGRPAFAGDAAAENSGKIEAVRNFRSGNSS